MNFMDSAYVQACMNGYAAVIQNALPVALFFAGCSIIVNTVITAFTSGKLRIGGK